MTDFWGNSSSDVFAVRVKGTILHSDGNTWSNMASGAANLLYAIWCSPASDVLAVGDKGILLRYHSGK